MRYRSASALFQSSGTIVRRPPEGHDEGCRIQPPWQEPREAGRGVGPRPELTPKPTETANAATTPGPENTATPIVPFRLRTHARNTSHVRPPVPNLLVPAAATYRQVLLPVAESGSSTEYSPPQFPSLCRIDEMPQRTFTIGESSVKISHCFPVPLLQDRRRVDEAIASHYADHLQPTTQLVVYPMRYIVSRNETSNYGDPDHYAST